MRLFNASNEDYRVVISEQDPDIVADRSAYDSAALVDIISYVDADMAAGTYCHFLLERAHGGRGALLAAHKLGGR